MASFSLTQDASQVIIEQPYLLRTRLLGKKYFLANILQEGSDQEAYEIDPNANRPVIPGEMQIEQCICGSLCSLLVLPRNPSMD